MCFIYFEWKSNEFNRKSSWINNFSKNTWNQNVIHLTLPENRMNLTEKVPESINSVKRHEI